MTQDEIIEMAVQAGMAKEIAEVNIEIVEAFYNLVAAKEREACAKTVETFGTWDMTDRFAAAIRARKETV